MRIIGGQAAGTILKVPKGLSVRPTPDRVRQAIFNSLGNRVVGASVLDLFSGSGALGLECLSRGADSVTSVEKSNRHATLLRRNAEACQFAPTHFRLLVRDAFAALTHFKDLGEGFDLITADPPFGEKNVGRRSNSLSQRLLDSATLPDVLTSGGILVLGHARRDSLTIPESWTESKVLRHGDSVIRFLGAS